MTSPCHLRLLRPLAPLRRASSRGFSLLTVLLMMAVLAFLALGALNISVIQERMAGNARDRNLALQAAEAALRDAEADIEANLSADSAFATNCGSGLCVPASMAASGAVSTLRWKTIDWSAGGGQSRAYGGVTGAAALPDVAAQPRYIVELLPVLPPTSGTSANLGSNLTGSAQAFRITARGVGLRSSTVVILQSTYIKQ
ncbi:MAG TPA: pilus assembly protein [Burkholderiaceae bacterium]|nr:pilus assembly protein [Burkholderiaceae bacterium]HMX09900.1 pilus assembly protein [Burkholderiaceae bacterium]HMY98778.1 pilus assembly protein [Burkholderiaceae bacterium]HNB43364.1 pilus assembly protein [Burkholderiaceae bacterium]HNG78983.1 pilus assembly protein [Burkholderiaceae bacterium]